MALDGIYLSLIRKELEQLAGSRVDKIYQPSKEELVLALRGKDGIKRILINTVSGCARIHLTNAEIENPKQPPMFCMLMRKHLSSGRLIGVRQDGFERILMLDFLSTNELGDPVTLTLVAEIMGRRSNLLLLDKDSKIIDCIKRVSPEVSKTPALPGVRYVLPAPTGKLRLGEFDRAQLEDRIMAKGTLTLQKALMDSLEGISPVFAAQCAFYTLHSQELTAAEMTEDRFDRLWFFLQSTLEDIQQGRNVFTMIRTPEGIYKDFCFCRVDHFGAMMVTKDFSSASVLLDHFYSERDTLSRTRQKAQDLFKSLAAAIERTERRVHNQQLELKECAQREQLKQYGDLIMANMYDLKKGMDKAQLVDLYDPDGRTVEVKLDKRLDPAANAQKYYKEYRKLDTAEKKLGELIASGEEEAKYLDSVFDALTRAQTEGDIAALRQELAEQGYMKHFHTKGKPPKALPPMKFVSSDGYEITVGRNNAQNDRLTCKESKKTDVWLHIKDLTGCHVIISCGGDGRQGSEEMPPERTIEEAAIIAAYYSKAKNSSRADVDYTFVKYVKKPSGSKPGMVIFTHNYTITVKPDEDTVEALRKR